MLPFIFITIFIVILGITITGFVMLSRFRTKGAMARGLDMSLFSVRVPREFAKEGGKGGEQQQKQERDVISVTEQMLSAMSHVHTKGTWLTKVLYGEPYIIFEIGVHHIGEEIHFYVATPNSYSELIEKQINSFYPTAEIKLAVDYNIFNPHGASAGAYLTLKSSPILPFRTYQVLPTDPVGAVLTTMSKLESEGEGVALQVLVRPSHKKDIQKRTSKVLKELQKGASWGEALKKAGTTFVGDIAKEFSKALNPLDSPSEQNKPEEQRQVLKHYEDLIKAVASKASKPIFDVNIRVVTSASMESKAEELLRDVSSAFVQFEGPDMNGFRSVKQNGKSLETFTRDYSFRIFNEKYAMYLSTEEIASFYHFPLPTTATPRVNFLKAKAAEPPPNLPKEGIILGANTYRGVEKLVRLTPEDRLRHLYIIGQTGTGKSSLLNRMVKQDIDAGEGVCIIDPHGPFADAAITYVPKERADDVIWFDPGDTTRPAGLNFLDIDPTKPRQKTDAIDGFYKVLKAVYKDQPEGFGPLFEKFFRYALILLLDDYANEIPTIADISRVFADEEYRNLKLSRETKGDVIRFWKYEVAGMSGDWSLPNMSGYVTAKFAQFLQNDYIRPIITQQKSAFNFREVMDQKKILIVKLSKGIIGDLNSNLIGMIMIQKILTAAFSRAEESSEAMAKLPPLYLYIDEFQNFATDDIETILSEARKYKLGMTIAHQFIKQIPEKIIHAIFGNVGSAITFRIGEEDAISEVVKTKFSPVFAPEDMVGLDNFNCYVKMLIEGAAVRPFNMQFNYLATQNIERGEQIKELSRMKYGRDLAEVEQEFLDKQKYEEPEA
ncbi:MAG: type IV secretion system DNA-binding domain-containing protein [Parcubacteria group bacterium]|nr:type IV secretion system DNA-binding domain-containing protein [Parcubacteria group bacterium]